MARSLGINCAVAESLKDSDDDVVNDDVMMNIKI